jgi:hypothetical protein
MRAMQEGAPDGMPPSKRSRQQSSAPRTQSHTGRKGRIRLENPAAASGRFREESPGESTTQALVTLLTVVLFGLGWAHVELDRGWDGSPPENQYAGTVEGGGNPR